MNIKVQAYNLSEICRKSGRGFQREIVVPMVYEAHLLDADYEGKDIVVWANHLVEHEKTLVKRRFRIIVPNVPYHLHYLWKYFKTLRSPTLRNVYHLFHYNE